MSKKGKKAIRAQLEMENYLKEKQRKRHKEEYLPEEKRERSSSPEERYQEEKPSKRKSKKVTVHLQILY